MPWQEGCSLSYFDVNAWIPYDLYMYGVGDSHSFIRQEGLPDNCTLRATAGACLPAEPNPYCKRCTGADRNIWHAGHYISEEECRQACTKCCGDTDPRCLPWAFSGECDNNPGFMKGACKLSCSHYGQARR